jgi:transaldolase
MPETTLKAFSDHGSVSETTSLFQSSTEVIVGRFIEAGIDVDALGLELQNEGAKSFVKSWAELMDVIAAKGSELLQVK